MPRTLMLLVLVGCADAFTPIGPASDVPCASCGPQCSIEGFDIEHFFAGNGIEGDRFEDGSCAFDGNCHSSSAAASQEHGLDLELPDPWQRLQGRASFHEPCNEFLLLDPERFQFSFLYIKLAGSQGVCGEPMPGGGLLPQDELDCVAAWLFDPTQ
ncbi:MAG: hypothetical protein AAF645_09795 [Myxococcota bacterium]